MGNNTSNQEFWEKISKFWEKEHKFLWEYERTLLHDKLLEILEKKRKIRKSFEEEFVSLKTTKKEKLRWKHDRQKWLGIVNYYVRKLEATSLLGRVRSPEKKLLLEDLEKTKECWSNIKEKYKKLFMPDYTWEYFKEIWELSQEK